MNMKAIRIVSWAVVCLFTAAIVSCRGQREAKDETSGEDVSEATMETVYTAIDRYLTETIGEGYDAAEYSIPFHSYTAVDESDPEDILVIGTFWLLNYNLSGDTLKTASGGAYPGKMHVRGTGDGYEVTSFEPVADGSGFTSSAKAIFGEKYDEFMSAYSDDKAREAARLKAVAEFVKANGLGVKFIQDFGWPAVEIPTE